MNNVTASVPGAQLGRHFPTIVRVLYTATASLILGVRIRLTPATLTCVQPLLKLGEHRQYTEKCQVLTPPYLELLPCLIPWALSLHKPVVQWMVASQF